MKRFYLFLLLLTPLGLIAQNVDQYLISTAGDYSENSNGSLSWSIGETVIGSKSNESVVLNQGFQQGEISIETLIDKHETTANLKLYPNPVERTLILETNQTGKKYELINSQGQVILNGMIRSNKEMIDIANYPAGIYFLHINNNETHKIIKH